MYASQTISKHVKPKKPKCNKCQKIGQYEEAHRTRSLNEVETTAMEQEIQQISLSLEYNTQIFQMTLLKVKMINGTSSSPVTDFKTSSCERPHEIKKTIKY